jgi:membrane fusion protein, multidrug efflux system
VCIPPCDSLQRDRNASARRSRRNPLEILDDRSLEVELIAPSRWRAWLKPGCGFAVHIEETDKTYPAVITRVEGRVDPVSQTIKVFGEIQGDANDLMAGMSGRANIPPPK